MAPVLLGGQRGPWWVSFQCLVAKVECCPVMRNRFRGFGATLPAGFSADLSNPFTFALLLVFGATAVGLASGFLASGGALGPSVSQSDAGKDVASVADAQTVVLQDGSDWLSEGYWQRRREKRQRQGGGIFDQTNLGVRENPYSSSLSAARRQGAGGADNSGNYRTVCVRLCDGYYFPVSFSTRKSQFDDDEAVCKSKCSSDTRLFYFNNSDGSHETMVDRSGRAYADLKNAFLYRTVYNKSCQCRPDPWSEAEKQRHAMYQSKDGQKQKKLLANVRPKRDPLPAVGAKSQENDIVLGNAAGASMNMASLQNETDGEGPDAPPVPEMSANEASGTNRRRRYPTNGRMSLGHVPRAVSPRSAPRADRSTRMKAWKRAAFAGDN